MVTLDEIWFGYEVGRNLKQFEYIYSIALKRRHFTWNILLNLVSSIEVEKVQFLN